MPDWTKVGRASDWILGRGRAVNVAGKIVAVFRTAQGFVAFQDACPHMGASLSDGLLHGEDVICFWHQWRFNVHTGVTRERDWACLERYEVRETDGELWIRVPDPPAPSKPEPDPEWLDWDPTRYFKPKDGSG